MKNNDLEMQIQIERSFYKNFDSKEFGKYNFLIGHSITSFKSIDQWENEILPYVELLRNKSTVLSDWNSFSWGGIICFRFDHVIIVDESLIQVGRRLPLLLNEDGKIYINEVGEPLIDTLFIENNYTEFVKISIENYIFYCKQWLKILKSR